MRELNPNDEFDRVIGFTAEAERRARADVYVRQYERGMIMVHELAEKLQEIADAPAGMESAAG